MKQHRLFFGFELPLDVRSRIGQVARPEWPARWTPVDRLHITLRFCGDVGHGTKNELVKAMADLPQTACAAVIGRGGVFPSSGHPRVLFMSVQPDHALCNLQAASEAVAVAAGLERERRTWSPHVTLARIRSSPAPWLGDALDVIQELGQVTVTPKRIVLFESTQSKDGLRYVPVSAVSLQPA